MKEKVTSSHIPHPAHYTAMLPMHIKRQGTCIKFDKGHITHKRSSAQIFLQICTSIPLSVTSTKILNLKEPKFPEKNGIELSL